MCKDNFEADSEQAKRLLEINPDLRRLATENRMLLGRAVRWLATDCGIRQFLDVGSGLPTAGNTHDVAQAAAQGSEVAYVDKDPMVVLHAARLLADSRDAVAVCRDAARPEAILSDRRVSTLIQPSRPYAVILTAVLRFFPLAASSPSSPAFPPRAAT
jgi:S-adenosyl methyltransferase